MGQPIGVVFVQVTSHVRDPARIAAHGGREGHTPLPASGRHVQGGGSPARPAVRAHGRPTGRHARELRPRAVKGQWVTPVMLAVERAIAEAIRQGARVSYRSGSRRCVLAGVEHGDAKPVHLVVADALEEPAHR